MKTSNVQNFGLALKKIRQMRGHSRESLAEGICSNKYIYLIEKGQRMPSAQVLGLLSRRLNDDLKNYILLSEYEDPIFIYKIVVAIFKARIMRNIEDLNEHVKELENFIPEDDRMYNYVLWNKSIYAQYIGDGELALSYCWKAVDKTRTRKQGILEIMEMLPNKCLGKFEYHILNTLIYLLYLNDYKEMSVNLALELIDNMNHYNEISQDRRAYYKALHNVTLLLIKEKKYKLAAVYLNKIIVYKHNNDYDQWDDVLLGKMEKMILANDNTFLNKLDQSSLFKILKW